MSDHGAAIVENHSSEADTIESTDLGMSAPSAVPADGNRRPLTAGVLLVLFGGIAGIAQLVVPWFAAGDRSTTGWQQYYSTAHHGVGGMIAAYAIIVGA